MDFVVLVGSLVCNCPSMFPDSLVDWHAHFFAIFLQLPRPKWMKHKRMRMPGLWLGRVAMVWNGALLVREVWYRFCRPGTFRTLVRAVVYSMRRGVSFEEAWKVQGELRRGRLISTKKGKGEDVEDATLSDPLNWYISTSDLQDFKDAVDGSEGGEWEKMFEKSWDSCSYVAWRRRRPNGKTEYKSVTIAEDATAQEFMDFYLDDEVRPKWDGLISSHSLLEAAYGQQHRCQVVRWLRSFPFAFISDREYVIARRMFSPEKDVAYGITKSIEHPAAPPQNGIVRMKDFYSMWRSRTVPCPKGTDRPACETTLLHFEDFGIPENLARFAVRHGMAGFVSNMVPHMKIFVEERRKRCAPDEMDPMAYGAGVTPVFPCGPTSLENSDALESRLSEEGSSTMEDSASESAGHGHHPMKRARSAKNVGYMLLASGVAIALSRSSSRQSLGGLEAASSGDEDCHHRTSHRRHHQHHPSHHHHHQHRNHHLRKRQKA